MAKKARTFRFSEDTIDLLKTWAFITEKEQQEILEEALQEYTQKRPDILEKVKKIISISTLK
ncbi:hypothetical protein P4T20_05240 [Aneurinibacillus thermoaerophilus]|jgi:predicted Fe-S protein YdhL (DUF1289 family)|uniref:hypothetical protein n=1 Tax=Aneurinibacillus thermoaerophilus TaxID=143495 RepID=UPI002E20BBB3|nr:hypothetical protein [Aneurinibacillus thermoaerophilus]